MRRPQRRASLAQPDDSSLLDLVDSLLNKGVVLDGEVVLGVASVDLVYLRLSAVFAAADRVLGGRRSTGPRSAGRRSRVESRK